MTVQAVHSSQAGGWTQAMFVLRWVRVPRIVDLAGRSSYRITLGEICLYRHQVGKLKFWGRVLSPGRLRPMCYA
jgi:hypothetical protein